MVVAVVKELLIAAVGIVPVRNNSAMCRFGGVWGVGEVMGRIRLV
jgi:hypothetical protein